MVFDTAKPVENSLFPSDDAADLGIEALCDCGLWSKSRAYGPSSW
jgi:hypothetical protein